jgi:hypothetical protein
MMYLPALERKRIVQERVAAEYTLDESDLSVIIKS